MIYMAITLGTLIGLAAAIALSIWSERQTTTTESVVRATTVSHCKVCGKVVTTGMVSLIDNGGHVCNVCYTWSVREIAAIHARRLSA